MQLFRREWCVGVLVNWPHVWCFIKSSFEICPKRRRVGDEGSDCPITQMDEKVGKNEIQYVAEKPVRSTVDFFKRSERWQHSNITIPPFLFVEKPVSNCLYYVFTVSGREKKFAMCVCVCASPSPWYMCSFASSVSHWCTVSEVVLEIILGQTYMPIDCFTGVKKCIQGQA